MVPPKCDSNKATVLISYTQAFSWHTLEESVTSNSPTTFYPVTIMFFFPQSYVQMPWQFPNYTDTLKTPQVAQQLMICMCISVCNQISTNIKPIVMRETIIKSCRELNIYICVCFSTAYSQSCILIFNFCQHPFRQTALTSHCIHNHYAVTEHLFKWYCLHKALCHNCSWN